MTKEQFKFSLICSEFSEDYRELADEDKWSAIPEMYKEFKKSYFFDPEKDEDICIINYLNRNSNE